MVQFELGRNWFETNLCIARGTVPKKEEGWKGILSLSSNYEISCCDSYWRNPRSQQSRKAQLTVSSVEDTDTYREQEGWCWGWAGSQKNQPLGSCPRSLRDLWAFSLDPSRNSICTYNLQVSQPISSQIVMNPPSLTSSHPCVFVFCFFFHQTLYLRFGLPVKSMELLVVSF